MSRAPVTRPRPRDARGARLARRPGHESSTAHLQAAYPFQAGGNRIGRGIYIGRDAYGQAFCCDPFELYEAGEITAPNFTIFGQVGTRKSTLVKTLFWRSYLFGRYGWVVDVKREYGPLADAMGGTRVSLRPGGGVRLNPISPLAGAEQQDALLQAVAAATLDRPLEPRESTGLTAALDAVRDRIGTAEPTLPDVAAALLRPTAEMADRLVTSPEQLGVDVRTVALALVQLCEGELRGMFDGPTSRSIDWSARMIVIDLADVANSRALAVLMTCASAAIQDQVAARHRRAELAQEPTPKTLGGAEEGWRQLESEQLTNNLLTRRKLCREYGESNILVLHRPSDLPAAGGDGSRVARLAEGLLSESDILVCHRQAANEVSGTQQTLALTQTEAELLPDLAPGVALWHVGRARSVVQHRVTEIERRLVHTDQRMALRRP